MDGQLPKRAPEWLTEGEIVGIGRVQAGSNATFAVAIQAEDGEKLAIYKPRKGERPLWDFPNGTLYKREIASFAVSHALGWDLVPPTVVREGPYGVGSLQQYCLPDERARFPKLRRKRREEFLKIALFDIVTNNADRKYEHCLPAQDGGIYAIDNGLSFHVEFKTKTVLVDFAGEPLPENLLEDLEGLATDPQRRAALDGELSDLLDAEELACFYQRIDAVCSTRVMPQAMPHWELYYGFYE